MKILWSWISRHIKKESRVVSVFPAVCGVLCMLMTGIAGFLFCMLLIPQALVGCMSTLLIICGYAGVVGYYGGILYLMRMP